MNPQRKSWNFLEGIETTFFGVVGVLGLVSIPVLILLSEEDVKAKTGALIALLAAIIGLPFIVKDIKRKKIGLPTGLSILAWIFAVLFIGYVR